MSSLGFNHSSKANLTNQNLLIVPLKIYIYSQSQVPAAERIASPEFLLFCQGSKRAGAVSFLFFFH